MTDQLEPPHNLGARQPGAQPELAETPAPEAEPFAAQSNAQSAPTPRPNGGVPRAGLIVAGIAIGAVVGGVAGAGVTALTIGQFGSSSAATGRESLTITNPDDATIVTAIAAKAIPSVVTLEVVGQSGAGTGSGVIISEDGYLLTNNHVVALDSGGQDASIRVFLSDGRILQGTLIGTDPYSDLAVVKIDATGLTPITFADSAKLNVGDLTVAIGAPLNLANTVTTGVVSALYRGITVGSTEIDEAPDSAQPNNPEDLWNFEFDQQQPQTTIGTVTIPVIQTDASINPGNSGGALLDSSGELIGINVAIASTASSSETAGSVGLGFAIPSNLAKRVAEELISGQAVSHGKLGVSVEDASGSADAQQSGALVREVTPGSAAAKAGIKSGDVIISVNGVPVQDGTALSGLVRYFPAGTQVEIEYVRNGKVNTAQVTLDTL